MATVGSKTVKEQKRQCLSTFILDIGLRELYSTAYSERKPFDKPREYHGKSVEFVRPSFRVLAVENSWNQ